MLKQPLFPNIYAGKPPEATSPTSIWAPAPANGSSGCQGCASSTSALETHSRLNPEKNNISICNRSENHIEIRPGCIIKIHRHTNSPNMTENDLV